jgi:hypothetical protein
MRATFKAARPEDVEVSFTLTATVAEWTKVKADLEAGGPRARELGLAVAILIGRSKESLVTERWTTGYAEGQVEEKSK